MRNRLPHRFIDVNSDPTAENVLRQVGVGPADTPVVVWRDRVLRNLSNAELARLVGLAVVVGSESTCDLLIVGAGPRPPEVGHERRSMRRSLAASHQLPVAPASSGGMHTHDPANRALPQRAMR